MNILRAIRYYCWYGKKMFSNSHNDYYAILYKNAHFAIPRISNIHLCGIKPFIPMFGSCNLFHHIRC